MTTTHDLPHWDVMTNARLVEAHLLDAHREGVSMIPREIKTLAVLREWHREAHDQGRFRFDHTHDPIDLPEPTGALNAGLLGR